MKNTIFLLMTGILIISSCQKSSTTKAFVCGDTITDIDGNEYNTVSIDNQCWTVENLKTTRYKDGSAISTDLNDAAWLATTNGAYAIYSNNPANNTTYGKLYNWYAVNTGKLAPTGWHIPTDVEWTTLIDSLGGETVAGGAMKAITGWNIPNTGATNSSGFKGLPAGYRYSNGTYYEIGSNGYFWSSTEYDAGNALYRLLYSNNTVAGSYLDYKVNGYSVRCIRD
jgi:uncharacterized protein (TIGR02145 family)